MVDDCNQEVLAIEVDSSLSSKKVIRVLDKIVQQRGKPKQIRVDNGPEFRSNYFEWW
ncbi:MAG: DDE-type integrase/transposase/recombinase [Chitinophagaceae bacterium]|nr:DDE-type integrase/transposase/recombinase [Chitinophagaceae bacterium]